MQHILSLSHKKFKIYIFFFYTNEDFFILFLLRFKNLIISVSYVTEKLIYIVECNTSEFNNTLLIKQSL